MNKLRERLAALADKLRSNKAQLAKAQRRYKANRQRAYSSYEKQVAARKEADAARANGETAKAARLDKVSARWGHRRHGCDSRAQWWLGQIKLYTQRIHNLETRQDELHKEAEAWRKAHKVTITGDKATGGTKSQRLKAVALASAAACASGKRPNFYSQAGEFDVEHCITGPAHGHRDDCSSWFTSDYKSCGLADPNGQRYTAGYTGTLEAHGKQVSSPQPGDAVLYGPPGGTHHVEMYVGPGDRTIGHGSAPVDPGIVNLFGDGQFRFFRFI